MTPILLTDRLLLEPYTPDDEHGYVALFQDRGVSRWMGDGPAPEAEDRARFGRIFSTVYARGSFDVWAVRRNGVLIGHAELKPSDTVSGHEIIYALRPASWGLGLGTELAEALVGYGLDVLRLSEVFATVVVENVGSLALLARVGFMPIRDIEEDDGQVVRVLIRRRPDRSS